MFYATASTQKRGGASVRFGRHLLDDLRKRVIAREWLRWSRGSDPRLLRLTLDRLPNHASGERPRGYKARPYPKARLPEGNVHAKKHKRAGGSNSKAVGAPTLDGFAFVPPYVPCSWTAFVRFSNRAVKECAASSLSSPASVPRSGTLPVRRGNSIIVRLYSSGVCELSRDFAAEVG
jgi:hypothetical protein